MTEESGIDVTNGHDHVGMLEVDDIIRGNLFSYHISMVVNEEHGMF